MTLAPCTVTLIPTILSDFSSHIDTFNTLMTMIFSSIQFQTFNLYGYTSVCVITHNSLGTPWSLIQTPSLFYPNSSHFLSLPYPDYVLSFLFNKFRVHWLLLKLLPSLTSSCTVSKPHLCPYHYADIHVWRKTHNLNIWSHFKLTDY